MILSLPQYSSYISNVNLGFTSHVTAPRLLWLSLILSLLQFSLTPSQTVFFRDDCTLEFFQHLFWLCRIQTVNLFVTQCCYYIWLACKTSTFDDDVVSHNSKQIVDKFFKIKLCIGDFSREKLSIVFVLSCPCWTRSLSGLIGFMD
jgi:hypothetical protein